MGGVAADVLGMVDTDSEVGFIVSSDHAHCYAFYVVSDGCADDRCINDECWEHYICMRASWVHSDGVGVWGFDGEFPDGTQGSQCLGPLADLQDGCLQGGLSDSGVADGGLQVDSQDCVVGCDVLGGFVPTVSLGDRRAT